MPTNADAVAPHIRAQTEREQTFDARAVRVGGYGRPLCEQSPGHRVRGDGDGDEAADADIAGCERTCRESDSGGEDPRRKGSRPRILPQTAAQVRSSDSLDVG